MQRRNLLIAALLLLILVFAFAASSSAEPGVPDTGKPGYLGSNVCKGCHSDEHTTLQRTLHPWKVRPKAEANIVGQFPVTMNGVTYTIDDVDWVIGAGPKPVQGQEGDQALIAQGPKWKQRYIDVTPEGLWKILPIQWNVEKARWDSYAAPAKDYRDACAGCHSTGYNVADKTWKDPGVTCEACHGPGQNHLANIGNPPGQRGIYAQPDSEVCGGCHVRGKSKDGLWDWPEGYVPGGNVHVTDVYSFTTATSAWWFDNPADPGDTGHAKEHRQQYIEWLSSGHSSAVEAVRNRPAACLECHSEDARRDPTITPANAKYSVECQTCHISHEPGQFDSQLAEEPYALCTECHNGHLPETGKFEPGTYVHHPMKEMFEGIGFPGVPDMPSRHFQDDAGASCNSCHMPGTAKSANTGDVASHLMKLAMPGDVKEGQPDSCSGCHTDSSKMQLQEVIDSRQAEIHAQLDQLRDLGLTNNCGNFETDGAPTQGASDACKLAFTGYKMVHDEGSFGMHNYFYAKAILKTSVDGLGGKVYSKDYVGSTTCAACHGETAAAIQRTLHPWKVRPKDEANIVGQFPVTMNGVTYTLDDVDWVIGAGPKPVPAQGGDAAMIEQGPKWKQRYIDVTPEGLWKVLPIQWTVATGQWAPYSAPSKDYRDACAGCHTTGYDVDMKQWVEPGINCEACHGPGMAHVLAPDKESDPEIVASIDSEICGACHLRGKTKDGKWDWPEGYVPGGEVHVLDVYSPTLANTAWWYDNPADPTDPGHAKEHRQQWLEWNRSAHSKSLESLQAISAPNFCLRCHSEDFRRDPTLTVQTAEFAIECVTCHTPHTTGVQGTSQLVKSQYALCTECHNGTNGGTSPITPGSEVHHPMQEMYEGRGMPGVEVNPSTHFLASDDGGGPVCSNCHLPETGKSGVITTWPNGMVKSGDISSHLLTPLQPGNAVAGEPNSCSACHDWQSAALQAIIDQRQSTTSGKLDVLEGWLAQLKAAGQTQNTDYKYGVTAHSFVASDGSEGFHNFPYATDILDTATDMVDGYRFLYLPTLLR